MKIVLSCISIFSIGPAMACTTCNKPVQEAIYGSTFYPNLFIMLSSFITLGLLVIILAWSAQLNYKKTVLRAEEGITLNPVPLGCAATILGIGLGGFIDGIWFHQILQWHEVLSNKIPVETVVGKSVNMFWDGVFHFFCWTVVLTGVILLWKLLSKTGVNKSGYLLSGGLLLGWGIFNIVEGTINHHILQLHYVRQRSLNPDIENLGLMGISLVLIISGISLLIKGKRSVR